MVDQLLEAEVSGLIEALRNEDCVLVMNSELAEMAGLPTVALLMQKPAEEIGIENQPLSVPEIAEYYIKSHPNAAMVLKRQLKKRLETQARYKDNHLLIKDLPFSVIITTSYDMLLEHAFEAFPVKDFGRVVIDDGLSNWDDKVTQIVKLLGSVDKDESIIIASSEFDAYLDRHPRIVQKVKSLALEKTFIFIGSRSQSHELRWLLGWIAQELQKSGKKIYMVMLDPPSYTEKLLEGENVRMINLGSTDKASPIEMVQFLRALSDRVKGLTTVPRASTRQTISPVVTVADQEKQRIIDNLINTRLGSYLSLRADPKAVDSSHHYELLGREDLLDYEVGDFFSIRTLRGVNITDGLSRYVIYSESSEVKLTFEECAIQAIDLNNGEPLVVERVGDEDLSFTQVFKIYFPCPIAPGERFDIEYQIRLPGELRALGTRGDAMSVSLARIVHGVDVLRFSVVLDKRPRTYWIDELTYEKGRETSTKRPVLEELDRDYKIQWSSDKAYRIVGEWQKPEAAAYFINYRFK